MSAAERLLLAEVVAKAGGPELAPEAWEGVARHMQRMAFRVDYPTAYSAAGCQAAHAALAGQSVEALREERLRELAAVVAAYDEMVVAIQSDLRSVLRGERDAEVPALFAALPRQRPSAAGALPPHLAKQAELYSFNPSFSQEDAEAAAARDAAASLEAAEADKLAEAAAAVAAAEAIGVEPSAEAVAAAAKVQRPSPAPTGEPPSKKQRVAVAEDVLAAVDEVAAHESAWPFLEPVKPEHAPDYHSIIKTPMDIGTARRRVLDGAVTGAPAAYHLLQQVYGNAYTYNARSSPVYKLAKVMDEHTVAVFKERFPRSARSFRPAREPTRKKSATRGKVFPDGKGGEEAAGGAGEADEDAAAAAAAEDENDEEAGGGGGADDDDEEDAAEDGSGGEEKPRRGRPRKDAPGTPKSSKKRATRSTGRRSARKRA